MRHKDRYLILARIYYEILSIESFVIGEINASLDLFVDFIVYFGHVEHWKCKIEFEEFYQQFVKLLQSKKNILCQAATKKKKLIKFN